MAICYRATSVAFAIALLGGTATADADAKAPCSASVKAPRSTGSGTLTASGRVRCRQSTAGSGTVKLVLVRESGAIDRKVRKLRGPFGPTSPARKLTLSCSSQDTDDPIIQVGTELLARVSGRRRGLARDSRLADWSALCPETSPG